MQIAAWFLAGVASAAQAAPEAAAIDGFGYADDAAARAVWEPMRGSAPVSVVVMEGRKVLRLPCAFAGSKSERASWDRKVSLDLSAARGVQFRLLCRNTSPVEHFSFYFQSGDGWYHGSFFPESTTDWNAICLDKHDFAPEGQPAGWGQIQTIRISAWRAKDRDTEFFLSDLRPTGVLGADAAVAIVRAASVAQRGAQERREVEQYAEAMAQNLRQLGIGYAFLNDSELTPEHLEQAKLVILPYNPSLPERGTAALVQYAGRGGRLLAFYSLPERLCQALQVQPGKHIAAPYLGSFAAIWFAAGALPGAPPALAQQSWNITAFQPVPGASRVLGEWFDDKGRPTGFPAVLGSSNGIVMTHVLLPEDAANKRRLLLAMAGALAPSVWRQTAEAEVAHIGLLAGFKTYEEAVAHIRRSASDEARVEPALAAAATLRAEAIQLLGAEKFPQAMDQSIQANDQMKRAFCLAQQPEPGEFRAFWCHSAFGVEGLTWDEAIHRLAENGFTAILPNMLWGGVAFYPSKVLPVAPQVAQRGDQIRQCLQACRKYGLQLHVWKVNWNLGAATPKEFVDQMRRAHRLQADASGKEEPWLCPSHPANQQLEIDSMLEVVRNYDVDGIHFDYIRYPDGEHCFCAGCRERFQRATGLKVRHWPQEVLAEGPAREAWLEWRRRNITAVVKAVSEQARALKPSIKISAAVFTTWTTCRDSVGQDWKIWCDQGYLDFVCPMDYTPHNSSFENIVTQQLPWAGRVPLYPGIGVSASSSRFGVDRLIEQINITRRHQTHGFTIFNYGVAESQELLPQLGLGITARRPAGH